jgi:HEAT repeat protein
VSSAQLDLFDGSSTMPAAAVQPAAALHVDAGALGDAELVDALPRAGLRESVAIVHEIARRRLVSGVPALAALCLRHAGFGRNKVIPQQKAAIEALGVIGGREVSHALARLIERGAFEGPGLTIALQEAVRLASPLSEPLVANLLRADDPGARTAAARCVRLWPKCAPILIELLQDLHEDVRLAAACALGRIGIDTARPVLLKALREQPSREVIEAIAAISDEEILVLLGRTAEIWQDLAGFIREVLDGIDHPLAPRISARIRHLDIPGVDRS